MKLIVVTGGVLSGIGKGISGASIGAILKASDYKIFMQKFDGYLNVDAGTINPYKHGEVFVMDDGAETDLDVGHYERFIDVSLNKSSCHTSGKLYEEILAKERKWDYLGQDVQIIPHFTDLIKSKIREWIAAAGADISIVEVGGTVGDMENEYIVEAMRQLRQELWFHDVVFVHLTYLPYLAATKELKTKPTQNSVRDLRTRGISPDFLITRADMDIPDAILEKVAFFCGVKTDHVLPAPTVESIYQIPLDFSQRNIGALILDQLKLPSDKLDMSAWKNLYENIKASIEVINIAMVGKYVGLEDAYYSLNEWLKVAWLHQQRKVKLHFIEAESLVDSGTSVLDTMDAICVPGGFGERGVQGMVLAAQYAREKKVPYLWVCLWSQIMAIEFARNVLWITDANSQEFAPDGANSVVHIMETQKSVITKGGTMRLGTYPCAIKADTLAYKVFGTNSIDERHRHRYEFNNAYREQMLAAGFVVSGTSPDGELAEIVEIKDHPYMIGAQFHPELISRPLRPHPMFVGLVKAAMERKG